MSLNLSTPPTRPKRCKVCGEPHLARGYCSNHYDQARRKGEIGKLEPAFDRHMRSLDYDSIPGCHLWMGPLRRGYGQHRKVWERVNGPIGEGVFVDHVCHNRACVNTEHLRLVSPAQNSENRRGAMARSATGVRGVNVSNRGFQVKVRGRYYGTYATVEEAERVATAKRRESMPYSTQDQTTEGTPCLI